MYKDLIFFISKPPRVAQIQQFIFFVTIQAHVFNRFSYTIMFPQQQLTLEGNFIEMIKKGRIRVRRNSDPPSQAVPGICRETHSLVAIIIVSKRIQA